MGILNILPSQLCLITHNFLLKLANILNPLFWYSAIHLEDIFQHNIAILYLRNKKVANYCFMLILKCLVLYIYTRSIFNVTSNFLKWPKKSHHQFKYLILDHFLNLKICFLDIIRYFKILQFPNNELWWMSKSTFQGLKNMYLKKSTYGFSKNWLLETSEKLVFGIFCRNI